jgi:hypothetical protein
MSAHWLIKTGLYIGCSAAVMAPVSADTLPISITSCPNTMTAVTVDMELEITMNGETCPALERSDIRSLLEQFATGSTFTYPVIPATCVSGTNLSGSLTPIGGAPVQVTGYSESVQRMFPEAQGFGNPMMIVGFTEGQQPFYQGSAMTVVMLQGIEHPLSLSLIFADRFTIDLSTYPLIDREELQVLGTGSGHRATGQFHGVGEIYTLPPDLFYNEPFHLTGTLCLEHPLTGLARPLRGDSLIE